MSEGKLDKMVTDEETHFLNQCRNAIVGLETQKVLKKIQANKEAATDKNKRDQQEFTGSILPDLSELLPKVFESSVVQVLISTCLPKNLENLEQIFRNTTRGFGTMQQVTSLSPGQSSQTSLTLLWSST